MYHIYNASAYKQLKLEASLVKNHQSEPIAPHPLLTDYYEEMDKRRNKVDQMFNSSAKHYDWITDLMSFGSGRSYRKTALVSIGLKKGQSLIDVGAGTGVIAKFAQDIVGNNGYVLAIDPSENMLIQAKNRGVKNIDVGLAESLPCETDQFDFLIMGYALRHIEDLNIAFKEYFRVLKPGGKVLLLEITCPKHWLIKILLKIYMKGIIPLLARVFKQSKSTQELMRYYWDTIESCVPPEVILSALDQAGFAQTHRKIVMGIFSEYTALKQ